MSGYLTTPSTQGVYGVKYGFQYLWRRSPSVRISKNIYEIGVKYFIETWFGNTSVFHDVLDIGIHPSFL